MFSTPVPIHTHSYTCAHPPAPAGMHTHTRTVTLACGGRVETRMSSESWPEQVCGRLPTPNGWPVAGDRPWVSCAQWPCTVGVVSVAMEMRAGDATMGSRLHVGGPRARIHRLQGWREGGHPRVWAGRRVPRVWWGRRGSRMAGLAARISGLGMRC